MKKTVFSLIPILAAAMISVFITAPVAHAYTCGKDADGNPLETSINFGNGSLCNADGASPITALLLWVINIMGIGVGIAVTVGIIFGGITYSMSDGDAGKAKEGQEIIVNAIIGLFLFMFMYAGANFLIPGGLFK